ncbi:Lantibiotic modifying enzyme [Serratia plymuthica]|nr:Lantibiotic modifying enzyme [Serratia plymuthica]
MKFERALGFHERKKIQDVTPLPPELIKRINTFHENEIGIEKYFRCNKKQIIEISHTSYTSPILRKNGRLIADKLTVEFKNIINVAKKNKNAVSSSDFNVFYTVCFEYFKVKLRRKIRRSDRVLRLNSLMNGFKEYIEDTVKFLSYRCLIEEVNLECKENNCTDITDFNKDFCDKKIAAFIERHPVLFRRIVFEIERIIFYIHSTIKKYRSDWLVINKIFGGGFKKEKILRITLGLGDPHNGKKTVCEIETERKNIIFKPRACVEIDFYSDAVNLINELECKGFDLYTPKYIIKKDRTWLEKITNDECTSIQEIASFYNDIGKHMALTHALSGIDFHYENVIAKGRFPVLIDLECLFTNPISSNDLNHLDTNSLKMAINKVSSSMSGSGFLPFAKNSRSDISALSRKVVKYRRVITQNDKCEFVTEKEYYVLKNIKHIPKYKGEHFHYNDFMSEIIDGFSKTYDFILENKNRLIQLVNAKSVNVRSRVLFKNTSRYFDLIKISTHPIFMKNMLDLEVLLATLWNDASVSSIKKNIPVKEISDLLCGDIPYFYMPVALKFEKGNDPEMVNMTNVKSPLHTTVEKINNMSLVDKKLQVHLINSLLTAHENNVVPLNRNHFYDKEFNTIQTDECVDLFSERIEAGFILDGHDNISLLSMYIHGETGKKYVSPMNNGMYDGIAGLAILYLSFYQVTNDGKYLTVANRIIKSIGGYRGFFKEDAMTSSYFGLGSYIYILHCHDIIAKCDVHDETISLLIQELSESYKKSNNYDFIYGGAGTLTLIVNLIKSRKKDIEQLMSLATLVYNLIVELLSTQQIKKTNEPSKGSILTGFSHGISGVIFAFCKYYAITGSNECIKRIKHLIELENGYKKDCSWLDLRDESHNTSMSKWCHGDAGILLSRLEAKKTFTNMECGEDVYAVICRDIEICEENIYKHGIGKGYTLCHGDAGNLICLSQLYRLTNDENGLKNIDTLIKKLVGEFLNDSGLSDASTYDLSLMVGYPGIAYLAAYLSGKSIPNVMTLDFPEKQ